MTHTPLKVCVVVLPYPSHERYAFTSSPYQGLFSTMQPSISQVTQGKRTPEFLEIRASKQITRSTKSRMMMASFFLDSLWTRDFAICWECHYARSFTTKTYINNSVIIKSSSSSSSSELICLFEGLYDHARKSLHVAAKIKWTGQGATCLEDH